MTGSPWPCSSRSLSDRARRRTSRPPPRTEHAPRAAITLLLLAAALPADARPRIEHWTTSSGARAYFVETHALPIVDVSVEFASCSAYDPPARAGLGQLKIGR